MKTLRMVCLCAVTACSLSAQIPAPTLYYPLDGSLPPVTGVMPITELAAPPVFDNLPTGWFVIMRADPEGGVNYMLLNKLGSLLFLK